MNQTWKNFLLAEQAIFETDTEAVFISASDKSNRRIYPVGHLTVLTVSGKDAATLLQGQITCNINDVSEEKSSLGALCNPKGKAIATFLLVKSADSYLLVLPVELLASVKKRLQMYVLRSEVILTDSTDTLCLIGLLSPSSPGSGQALFATTQDGAISINLSSNGARCLIIAEPDKAMALWSEHVRRQGFQPENTDQWRYLDISAGIPWLTTETSEEFIPQMLNLDKLGGISFNKGCYTGQEIVARTHYLGKAKRALVLAECNTPVLPAPNSTVIDISAEPEQPVGKVLLAQNSQQHCNMLIVLQITDNMAYSLGLKEQPEAKLSLLSLNI
jgi:folate-binding protein YgfZ